MLFRLIDESSLCLDYSVSSILYIFLIKLKFKHIILFPVFLSLARTVSKILIPHKLQIIQLKWQLSSLKKLGEYTVSFNKTLWNLCK